MTVQPLDILRRGQRIVGADDGKAPSFPRALALAKHRPLKRIVTHRIPTNTSGLSKSSASMAMATKEPRSSSSATTSSDRSKTKGLKR